MSQNLETDLFFSYVDGDDGDKYIKKINDIYLLIREKLTDKIWWGKRQIACGNLIKRDFDKLRNTKILISFISRSCVNSEKCMRELAQAGQFEIPIIFYIIEDVSNKSDEQILKEIFSSYAVFYLGLEKFFTDEFELMRALERKLNALSKKSQNSKVKMPNEDFIIVNSYPANALNDVNMILSHLSKIVIANYDLLNPTQPNVCEEKISNADLTLMYFNDTYTLIPNFDLILKYIRRKRAVNLKLQQERANYEYINLTNLNFDKCINLFEDRKQEYLAGRGEKFNDLVLKIVEALPKSFLLVKKTDITIIADRKTSDEIKMAINRNDIKIEVSSPGERDTPNYDLISDAKLLIITLTDKVIKCDNSVQEIKYCKKIHSSMIFIENEKEKVENPDIISIIKENVPQNNFRGLEKISTENFKDVVNQNLSFIDKKTELLEETVDKTKGPREKFLASGSYDNKIKIWNFPNLENEIHTLNEHKDSILCLEMIDSHVLASGSKDNTIKIWNLNSQTCVETLTGHDNFVFCLQYIAPNFLASGSGSIKIWDLNNYNCIKTCLDHQDRINCFQFISKVEERKEIRLLFSASVDRKIKIWNCDDNFTCVQTLEGHTGSVTCIKLINKLLLASGSSDKTIKFWNLNTNQCDFSLTDGHKDWITCLQLVNEDKEIIASGGRDKTIILWNWGNRTIIQRLRDHDDLILCLLRIDSKFLASGSRDKTIKIWDLSVYDNAMCIQTCTAHDAEVSSLVFLN